MRAFDPVPARGVLSEQLTMSSDSHPLASPHLTYFIPTVYEQTHRGPERHDIYSRLLMDRIVFLGTEINDDVANAVIAQLLFLESQDPEKDVFVYLNSPGGSITAGLAIYDTMQYIRPDVATICVGQAASMAALLLCSGAKGKRRALPHARVMIHQPWGGAKGQASDIEIVAREILRLKDVVNGIIARHTGRDLAQVHADTERDRYMTALEAQEYGIIDEVIEQAVQTEEDE